MHSLIHETNIYRAHVFLPSNILGLTGIQVEKDAYFLGAHILIRQADSKQHIK